MSEGSAVAGEVGGELVKMSERQLLLAASEEGEGGVDGGVRAIVV